MSQHRSPVDPDQHVDVLIVGAGLSGIGAAHQIATTFPGLSLTILESRDAIGGTWDLFRYPGVRSDSDMHTLGYRFRPWTDPKSIADGPSIRDYIRDTAREGDLESRIRFGLTVTGASWSTPDACWTVTARDTDGAEHSFTCAFLYSCSGYYRYDRGYTPDLPGLDTYGGTVVHPQLWPEHLDYRGKRVVVIGSGATAVTLVPAMAADAAHVTMLQRSPTYVLSTPSHDRLANALRPVIGARAEYAITRWKNVLRQLTLFQLCQRCPRAARRVIRALTKRALPAGFDVDTHFKPAYDPWDQRLCAVPDGDLFDALSDGSASVVTDHIETFTPTGIRLRSGAELDADLVVTATGLELQTFGGLALSIDGAAVEVSDTIAYKGMMLSGVPNFAFTVGYTNSSWTLKADLVAEFVCRVLDRMASTGVDTCVPANDDPDLETRPLLDFGAGYVQRALDQLPRAGARKPWRLSMSYPTDLVALRHGRLDDGVLTFRRSTAAELTSA